MDSSRKALSLSLAGRHSEFLISALSVVILSRLLTPQDIGVFTTAAFFTAIAHMMRDFGVGQYIIREHDLSVKKISSVLAVTYTLGFTFAALIWGSAHQLAYFFNEPRLEQVLHVIALNFLLVPFSATVVSYLRRALRFDQLYWITVVEAMVRSGVTIILAYHGFAYMSLAWGSVAGLSATFILANYYRPSWLPWRPGLQYLKEVLQFGWKITLVNLSDEFGKGAVNPIIAKYLGMGSVGYFSRGQGLIDLFAQWIGMPVTSFSNAYFSREMRRNRDLSEPYLRLLSYLMGVAWPFFVMISLLSSQIVLLLYGKQWLESIPLVQVLCLCGILSTSVIGWGSLLVISGHVKQVTQYSVCLESVRVLAVLGSVRYGLQAVCWSLVVIEFVKTISVVYLLKRYICLSLKKLFKQVILPNLLLVIFVLLPVWLLRELLLKRIDDPHVIIEMIAVGSGALLGWLLGVVVLRHPLLAEIKPWVKRKIEI